MKPSVLIELDKPRNIRLNTNALVKVEEVTGRPIASLLPGTVGIREIRAFLWAGLIHEDRELTLYETGLLMDKAPNYEYVEDKVTEAIKIAMNYKENEETDPN